MNNKTRLVIVKCILFGIFLLNISYGQEEMHSADFYLQKYEEYLKSLKCISFSYQNILPNSSHHGEFKYNGKYSFGILFNENSTNTPEYARESICSETTFQLLQYNKSKTEAELFSYLNPSKAKNYKLESNIPLPGVLGYIFAYPLFDGVFIPHLLRSLNPQVTKDTKNSMELILLSGKKDNITIKVWLDPAQNFLMRFLEIHQFNTSKTGDTITKSIVLDKFIDIQNIKFPTYYEISNSRGHINNKEISKGVIAAKLDNITITDNSNPTPFSFKTKIPNGTKAVLFDAQQIQYVWLDGEIVPRTDEVALAIARGGHKFIPGPKESRFWFMALGLILILLGGGSKLYSMLKENNTKEKEEKGEQ
jgi:hypothetical protein